MDEEVAVEGISAPPVKLGDLVQASYSSPSARDNSPAQEKDQTPGSDEASPITTSTSTETIDFKIQFGKDSKDVKRLYDSTVGELKAEIEKTIGIPSAMQKLMLKGVAVKDDSKTLREAGLKSGVKLLLIGSVPTAVEAAKAAASGTSASDATWDDSKPKEPLCKQEQHAKVLAKGRPEDAMAGLSGKQVPMPDSMTAIPGLLSNMGTKVRLTFRADIEQLWLGSATSTQKMSYRSITKIESEVIEGDEAYSIVGLHLGTTTNSKLWLYFFPSQYVAGLKIRILGVQSLI